VGLNEDIESARRQRLRFKVSRKEQRGAPWLGVFEGEDLEEALSRARAETAYEAAVFVVTNSGGFIYWTSAAPDVFNSTVVQP
jgi:hypothetical protein